MARFFFHIVEGDSVVADGEGLDCNSVEKAKREALASLSDLLRDAATSTKPFQAIRLIIADADGVEVAAFSIIPSESATRLN